MPVISKWFGAAANYLGSMGTSTRLGRNLLSGAGVGAAYGAFSDNNTMIGGALQGAMMGGMFSAGRIGAGAIAGRVMGRNQNIGAAFLSGSRFSVGSMGLSMMNSVRNFAVDFGNSSGIRANEPLTRISGLAASWAGKQANRFGAIRRSGRM